LSSRCTTISEKERVIVGVRAPSDDEYLGFDGERYPEWKRLSESWCCPCCGRSKRGILRWHRRTGSWGADVREHHDHSGRDRFSPTVICGGCNLANAIAKRSCAAPDWFSFSPAEIRRFVTGAKDNGTVFIDVELARSIYPRARSSTEPLVT
jgi:hypothetical protein